MSTASTPSLPDTLGIGNDGVPWPNVRPLEVLPLAEGGFKAKPNVLPGVPNRVDTAAFGFAASFVALPKVVLTVKPKDGGGGSAGMLESPNVTGASFLLLPKGLFVSPAALAPPKAKLGGWLAVTVDAENIPLAESWPLPEPNEKPELAAAEKPPKLDEIAAVEDEKLAVGAPNTGAGFEAAPLVAAGENLNPVIVLEVFARSSLDPKVPSGCCHCRSAPWAIGAMAGVALIQGDVEAFAESAEAPKSEAVKKKPAEEERPPLIASSDLLPPLLGTLVEISAFCCALGCEVKTGFPD